MLNYLFLRILLWTSPQAQQASSSRIQQLPAILRNKNPTNSCFFSSIFLVDGMTNYKLQSKKNLWGTTTAPSPIITTDDNTSSTKAFISLSYLISLWPMSMSVNHHHLPTPTSPTVTIVTNSVTKSMPALAFFFNQENLM